MGGPYDTGGACSLGCGLGADAEGLGPIVYVFVKNDIPNIRSSGSRDITTIPHPSFDPDPQSPDNAPQDEEYVGSEVKDGLSLHSYEL